MRKIRIGNDIRLKLKIKPNEAAGFYTMDELDQSGVKQLRCYLINTSFSKPPECEDCKKFKRVGFPDFYHPTENNINNAGFPSYHMMPANVCNYNRFLPDFHDYHWWPGYRGFGHYPEHFHGHTPVPDPSVPVLPPDVHAIDTFGKDGIKFNGTHMDEPFYLADSQVLHETNTLTCMFPAVQQKFCGIYKLVVVLTVFEQGWGRHNLRTYTIDKSDVFELVDDDSGESGNIIIDTDSTGARENVLANIYAESDDYMMATRSKMLIGEHDVNGENYNIYATLKDGSVALYNPSDWHFNELLFSSSNPEVLSVGADGTLYAHELESGFEETVQITVKDIDNNVSYTFNVTVKDMDTLLMGFSPKDDIEQVDPSDDFLVEYSAKDKWYALPNGERAQYLWIFSQRRIHYIKSTDDFSELAAELSSGFRVPMTDAIIHGGYYCYRSAAPILDGTMNIKIKFA